MLGKELYKTGIHYGGFFVIIVLSVFLCLFRLENHMASNLNLEYVKNEFLELQEAYGLSGKWSQEKQEILDKLVADCKEKDDMRGTAVARSLQGTISKQEYIQIMEETKTVSQERCVLEQFQAKFANARKNQEQYIMYDNGWGIFLNTPYGYFSFLVGLVLATIVWIPEFSGKNNFYDFSITTQGGKRRIVWKKSVVMLLFSLIYTILEQLLFMVGLSQTYSFADGNYPIQSISIFSECSFNISIWQGVFLLLLCRIFLLYLFMMAAGCIILLFRNVELVVLSVGVFTFVLGTVYWSESFWFDILEGIQHSVIFVILAFAASIVGQFLLMKLWERDL